MEMERGINEISKLQSFKENVEIQIILNYINFCITYPLVDVKLI